MEEEIQKILAKRWHLLFDNLENIENGNGSPTCNCETLINATITNAHILSASVPDKDSMCRATVIVNHSPANDSVVVLVTLQYPRSS